MLSILGVDMVNKKEIAIISVLTAVIAFMDMSGIPSCFFVNVNFADINPIYFTLMVNFIIIGILAFTVKKFLCPNWKLGFQKDGLTSGLKKYGIICVVVGIITCIAFCIGLQPFNAAPSIWKVMVEGIIYYIGVAIVEELYVRGFLLNVIEKLFYKRKNKTIIAVILSSVIFGLGHIFGTLGQPILVIISKVVWTTGMGMYFGAVYKKTNNLWVSIIMHFFINICALPYCFTTFSGYADISLYIILPAYLLLGVYSLYMLKDKNNSQAK